MLRLRGDDRDGLDGRGAGADDADPLAAEIHLAVRPASSVVGLALEVVAPFEIGQVRARKAARGHHAEARQHHFSRVQFDAPAARLFVEDRALNAGVEGDVALQVEAFRHMFGVAQDLRLPGVALGPLPLLLQRLVEAVGILHALHVAARAGIAIPVPGAADAASRLEDAHRKASAPQPMQHVEPGESGAHDHRVAVRFPLHSSLSRT